MNRKPFITIISFAALIFLLFGIVWAAYFRNVQGTPWAAWTGLEDKTLWDLLDLLIVPIFLALGGLWFNQQQKIRDARVETDRKREESLQNYLDSMSSLLIDHELHKSAKDDAKRDVARSQTLTTLRMLDPVRKGFLLRFLYEADLIKTESNTLVLLKGADLRKTEQSYGDLLGVNLSGTQLNRANLENTNLSNTDLREADLSGANLSGANLRYVNLSRADLRSADLSGAILRDAKLSGANLKSAKLHLADLSYTDLSGAILAGANLSEANLSEANLNSTNLRGAKLVAAKHIGVKLIGAVYNKYTIWPDNLDPNAAGAKDLDGNRK